jgi:release factor glutamine methyltransferase
MPGAEVWGCDISDDALNLARRNGSELDIRIDFLAVDFLDAAQRTQLPMYNIIVSNPPYIPQGQRAYMHNNVVHHEPHAALFVPDEDPLVFYRALAEFGASGLEKQGSIYMEINEEFGERVLQLLQENGYNCELRKDLQGKDRMIRASMG